MLVLIEEVRFAMDSPVEGERFELLVPTADEKFAIGLLHGEIIH
jgi:hypothetical protein